MLRSIGIIISTCIYHLIFKSYLTINVSDSSQFRILRPVPPFSNASIPSSNQSNTYQPVLFSCTQLASFWRNVFNSLICTPTLIVARLTVFVTMTTSYCHVIRSSVTLTQSSQVHYHSMYITKLQVYINLIESLSKQATRFEMFQCIEKLCCQVPTTRGRVTTS